MYFYLTDVRRIDLKDKNTELVIVFFEKHNFKKMFY